MVVPAGEVLILDSNIFLSEIGLTSRRGSALKHYLSRRGMQLVVPEVVAEECERHLINRAGGKKRGIEDSLQWLGRFLGRVSGWRSPNDETIDARARALARAEHLGAVVVRETLGVRGRADSRHQGERPPSHRKPQLSDCRIWEQCMELLSRCHVVFVSGDGDFRGHGEPDRLHPMLRAEAGAIAEDRNWTFHRTMKTLLEELRSEIQPISDDVVFAFIYESIASDVEKLASRSGCHPKRVGQVKQTLLTTDEAEILEVRLEMTDIWQSADAAKTMDFRFSGSCHYRQGDDKLCELTPSRVSLLTQQPDGSVRAVKGSYVSGSMRVYAGTPPIRPEPQELRT